MITDNDELRVMRAFRAEDAVPDPDARAAARVALLERIEAEAPAPARAAMTTSVRRPRRRLLAGGLGFVASAAAAAAIVVGGSGSVQPVETANAADALQSAATVAAGGPGVTLGSGEYWYVSSETRTSSKSLTAATPNGVETYKLVNVRERTERWIDSDGGGRTVTHTIGKPQFATPADRATWIAAGRPSPDEATPWTLSSAPATVEESHDGWKALSGLSYGELRRLSADDSTLADRLARVADETPGKTFAFAAYLLRTTPISPAQRAALYRVMADIPGVELLGTVKDERGRAGTGVALERDGWRVDVLFDPETALLLDFSSTATEPQAASDTEPAQHEEAFLAAGVVDSTNARP